MLQNVGLTGKFFKSLNEQNHRFISCYIIAICAEISQKANCFSKAGSIVYSCWLIFNIPLTGDWFEKSVYVLPCLVVAAIVLEADEGEYTHQKRCDRIWQKEHRRIKVRLLKWLWVRKTSPITWMAKTVSIEGSTSCHSKILQDKSWTRCMLHYFVVIVAKKYNRRHKLLSSYMINFRHKCPRQVVFNNASI